MSDQAAVHCTDHPDRELVRGGDRYAPWRIQADQRLCLDPEHGWQHRHRCARCGGPIDTRKAYRSIYCGTRCRVAALRARRRNGSVALGGAVTASPGPNAGVKSAPGETVQEVQE